MNTPTPTISVKVDGANPGQFFACCGLLELADRLWPGATGWFEDGEFRIECAGSLNELLQSLASATLEQLDPQDDMASPMLLQEPFKLALDWWTDEIAGGKRLKVWAGSMRSARIARAMKSAMGNAPDPSHIFDFAEVVFDPDQPTKKVEPYYFDSRRGRNAQALDIGFAPDSLKMKTAAYPAVEFLCLVGLQRCRPTPTILPRVFEYCVWSIPTPTETVAAIVCGSISVPGVLKYRFENAFRTDQKKHKSFLPSTQIGA